MMYMMATHAEEAWRQKRAISYNDPIKTGGGCKNLQRCKYINFDRWVGSKCWFHERPEGPMHWESFANCYSPWPDTQVDVARGWKKKKKKPYLSPNQISHHKASPTRIAGRSCFIHFFFGLYNVIWNLKILIKKFRTSMVKLFI